MIDDIVEMILKEARGRNIKDFVVAINSVQSDVDSKLMDIFANIREEERRKREDENKG